MLSLPRRWGRSEDYSDRGQHLSPRSCTSLIVLSQQIEPAIVRVIFGKVGAKLADEQRRSAVRVKLVHRYAASGSDGTMGGDADGFRCSPAADTALIHSAMASSIVSRTC
jgi:hypothetical protein